MKFFAWHWFVIFLGVIVLTLIEVIATKKYKRPGRWVSIVPIFVRWMLVVIVFGVILVASRPFRDLERMPFISGGPGLDVKTNMDELKWMLTILAGFAVITAIAQAAAAWFSALTYDKQAKAKLDELDKVLAELKARYPVFGEVEDKRNAAHEALVGILREVFAADDPDADPTEAISWIENFYAGLEVEKRQLILSVESFASVDLHPPKKGSYILNLKLFAIFYHAKARYEKKIPNCATFADLERAEGYLCLAIRKSPADFTLYNELGNLYVTMSEISGELPENYPDYLAAAEKQFLESRRYRKDQQRVYYNLAYIQARRRNFEAARDQLLGALKYKNWQKLPAPNSIEAYVYYNLGCYQARIIARQHSGALGVAEAQPVLSCLQKASELGHIQKAFVDPDYTNAADGDIKDLYDRADQALRKRLDDLRIALTAEETKKRPPTFGETVANAFHMIWDSAKEQFGRNP